MLMEDFKTLFLQKKKKKLLHHLYNLLLNAKTIFNGNENIYLQ